MEAGGPKLRSKSALLIIDIQNDFCEPNGSLAIKGSLSIIPLINKLREHSVFDHVFLCRDWHPKDHVSFACNHIGGEPYSMIKVGDAGRHQVLWPTHCVQGTFGAKYHRNLIIAGSDFEIIKGKYTSIDSYSCFGEDGEDTELGKRLAELEVKNIFCCGLGLDSSVGSTAEDATKRGFNTYLVKDCSKSVALDSEKTMM